METKGPVYVGAAQSSLPRILPGLKVSSSIFFFPQALLFYLKKEKSKLRRDDIYNALQDRPDLQTPAAPVLFE